MALDRHLWNKTMQILQHNPNMSRQKLAQVLNVSQQLARQMKFAFANKHLIMSVPQKFNGIKNCLVISDIHIPFHDTVALQLIFQYVQDMNIDTIVILGDLLDFYQISNFSKNPKQKDVGEQICMGHKFLSDLRNRFPQAKIIYKQGNHEQRLRRQIWQSKYGSALGENFLPQRLKLKQLCIDYEAQPFQIGNLWFLHGHQLNGGRSMAEHVVNMIFRAVNDNFIVGHFHRCQQNFFRRISGETFCGYAVGHLAKRMDYAIINKWVQSFAIVTFDCHGDFRVASHKILNGVIH